MSGLICDCLSVVCPFNLVVVCPTNLSLDIIELPGLIIYIASCLEVFENCLITYVKMLPSCHDELPVLSYEK